MSSDRFFILVAISMALTVGVVSCKKEDRSAPNVGQPADATPKPSTGPGPTQPPGVRPDGPKPVSESEEAALQGALDELASQVAPAATPIGDWSGNFQQGHELAAMVELEPGGCYTAVAVALHQVARVDLQLAEASDPSRVLAQDGVSGSRAVLGGAPTCLRWERPETGQARLVLRVVTGSGLAAMRLLRR